MRIEWTNDRSGDESYLRARVDGRDAAALELALEAWWSQLLELASGASDWDTIVADLWVDTGRLIGHVQRRDQAVGMDRGFRVCLSFTFVVEDLEGAGYSADAHADASRALERLLDRSIRHPPTRGALVDLQRSHPFILWWCESGGLVAEPTVPS